MFLSNLEFGFVCLVFQSLEVSNYNMLFRDTFPWYPIWNCFMVMYLSFIETGFFFIFDPIREREWKQTLHMYEIPSYHWILFKSKQWYEGYS